MARSATNKAKTKAKKAAPKAAPRPRAQINARAKLMNAKTVAGEKSGYGQAQKQETCVELTLRISMGAPSSVQSWPEYKQSPGGWNRNSFIDAELRKLKPAKAAKPAKAKKGETPAEPAPTPILEKFDEAAERKKIGDRYDAELKAKYERDCDRVNASNMRFMQRAAAFTMFMALRGQDVQLSLSPIQQGFKELFGGSQAQLPSGQPDDEDTDAAIDEYEDEYGDDDE